MTINTLIKPSVKACTQISHNVKTMCLFSGLGDLHPNRKKKLLSEDPPSQSNSNPYGHGGWRLDATLFFWCILWRFDPLEERSDTLAGIKPSLKSGLNSAVKT